MRGRIIIYEGPVWIMRGRIIIYEGPVRIMRGRIIIYEGTVRIMREADCKIPQKEKGKVHC